MIRLSHLTFSLLLLTFSANCLFGQTLGDTLDAKGATLAFRDGFVNIRVVDNHFRVYFLDAEKKLMDAPVSKGWIRYKNPTKGKTRNSLTLKNKPLSKSGIYLINPIPVQPPHKLFVFFGLGEGKDQVIFSNVKLYQ